MLGFPLNEEFGYKGKSGVVKRAVLVDWKV